MLVVHKLFTLKSDMEIRLNSYLPAGFAERIIYLLYMDNQTFMCVGNIMKIYRGYSWDGCSPKLRIGKYIIGTPDGRIVNGKPITYEASLVHDILYEHMEQLVITRKDIDKIFYYMLKKKGFKLSKLYYVAVRLLGGIFHKLNKTIN